MIVCISDTRARRCVIGMATSAPQPTRRPAPGCKTSGGGGARHQEPYTLNSLWSVWYGTVAIAFQVNVRQIGGVDAAQLFAR